MTEKPANRLAAETSTYLKGAAHQPVAWYPWGEDAFRRAKELDRPILLDIGATWCHWCHVIDRESYEDPELAQVINDHFVAIKVDRDERPDIDARYQQAIGAIAGQGGWPLTGFLTPDGKAYYGGTYFPPKDAHGRPSFRRVLLAMSEYYRTNRADTLREAEALHRALAEGRKSLVEDGVVNEALLKESADSLRGQFDPVNGGVSGQQKFPHAGTMEWVMARYRRTREEGLRTIVTRTLTSMARGGVYDQVGGGFHRYSTDPRWIVPHFEKMLYDNAGLLRNYVHAWMLTKDPLYRETAEGILAWADEVLSDRAQGGYYASQDADVGLDDDGDYFTWTLDELKEAASLDEARVLALRFEVQDRGEMHHNPRKNVLFVDQEPEAIAKSLDMPVGRVRELIDSGRRNLKAARDRRPVPGVDDDLRLLERDDDRLRARGRDRVSSGGSPRVRPHVSRSHPHGDVVGRTRHVACLRRWEPQGPRTARRSCVRRGRLARGLHRDRGPEVSSIRRTDHGVRPEALLGPGGRVLRRRDRPPDDGRTPAAGNPPSSLRGLALLGSEPGGRPVAATTPCAHGKR